MLQSNTSKKKILTCVFTLDLFVELIDYKQQPVYTSDED